MIFRLRDFIGHPLAIYNFRKFLTKSEKWPKEKLDEYRLKLLKRTINQAINFVPYYQQLFREAGIAPGTINNFDDLKKIPLLEKDAVNKNFEQLKSKNWQKYEPLESHTSGSTGTSMHFLLDKQTNILEFAALWRVLNWSGYKFGQRYANIHGRVTKGDRFFEYDWRTNALHLSSFNFKKENIKLYNEKLKSFRPKLIKAYPSSISLFARWLAEQKISPYQPQAILTSSESLLDHQREIIKTVFNCPIFDFYGQNERAALISTCPQGNYHIHQEYSHLEILDENGQDAKPGTIGEIVTTSFHNLAMPLIRYRTRDLAMPSTKPCSCGRPYPTVERIIGRIEDIIVTPDGRHVGRLDAAFKLSKGIRLSQIIQQQRESITVKIVKTTEYREQDEQILLKELRSRLGQAIKIDLDYVDKIEIGKNGKIKFVISKIAPNYQFNQKIDHSSIGA